MPENCWEMTNCQRQPGGRLVKRMGECPAATRFDADGVNRGRAGGRICWAIAGTLCRGRIQGDSRQKRAVCILCPVYQRVAREEGNDWVVFWP